MSEQKENQGILSFDWALFYYWLMATTGGWVLGWLLLPTISVVTAGVGAGVMQCFVLYRRMPRAWRWIPVQLMSAGRSTTSRRSSSNRAAEILTAGSR